MMGTAVMFVLFYVLVRAWGMMARKMAEDAYRIREVRRDRELEEFRSHFRTYDLKKPIRVISSDQEGFVEYIEG